MAAMIVTTQPSRAPHAVNEYSFLELVEDGEIRLTGRLRGLPLDIMRAGLLLQS